MQFKPTEYCKVCKNYDAVRNHCEKGWEIVFCDKEDFEPSFENTVLNLLNLLDDSGIVENKSLRAIANWIEEMEAKNEK
jgi:hypothetical protein